MTDAPRKSWLQKIAYDVGKTWHHLRHPDGEVVTETRTTVEEKQLDETTTLRRTTIEEVEIKRSPAPAPNPDANAHGTD